jgi:hypothetical protein
LAAILWDSTKRLNNFDNGNYNLEKFGPERKHF